MANPKIPKGYQGTFFENNGNPVLVMVSRSDSIADDGKTTKKEQKPMNEQQQTNSTFTPYTTEQKREFAKQFTPEQRKSYRKGQQNAYAHMGNIGRRNSSFIYNNLKNDEAATPPPAANKPRGNSRKNGQQ